MGTWITQNCEEVTIAEDKKLIFTAGNTAFSYQVYDSVGNVLYSGSMVAFKTGYYHSVELDMTFATDPRYFYTLYTLDGSGYWENIIIGVVYNG